ncbi:MAG: tyrosine-type recombinase/integrase [Candidatus Hodarchaeota archaeon]
MRINERIKRRYFSELERNCQLGLTKVSTFAQRKKAVKYFMEFLNNRNLNLKAISSLHVQEFLQYLSNRNTIRGGKFAPATLKQIYALVKSFYVRCYEKQLLSTHPDLIFTKNALRRYKLGKRKLPKYINQENMIKLLSDCPDSWKALLHFMYDTGARISEVLEVQIEHLDLDRNLVRIFEPKTMNVRVTSLSETTIQLLRNYLSKYRPTPKGRYKKFVFINQQKRKMTPRAVQYYIKRLSTTILGKKNAITPHYFRAACAVHLLESGVDIRQVQEIIGWKSLTVAQNYTRVTPQRQIQLKMQHHPGFKSKISDQKIYQTQNQEEIGALRELLRQERLSRRQERERYEQNLEKVLQSQTRETNLASLAQQIE